MEEKKKFDKEEFKAKAKEKLHAGMEWTKARFYDAKAFYEENKEFLLVIVPIGLGGLKWIKAQNKTNEEKDHKELYIWDNRSGQYYRLRRKLRPGEQLELERRRLEGEPVGQILMSMRVL